MQTLRKIALLIYVVVSLSWFASSCNQTTTADTKLSVEERMAKARAAKIEKKANQSAEKPDPNDRKPEKATAADYQTPVDKVLKGPNGEVVHVGERGANYYINKNGNKTYLSSNQ